MYAEILLIIFRLSIFTLFAIVSYLLEYCIINTFRLTLNICDVSPALPWRIPS